MYVAVVSSAWAVGMNPTTRANVASIASRIRRRRIGGTPHRFAERPAETARLYGQAAGWTLPPGRPAEQPHPYMRGRPLCRERHSILICTSGYLETPVCEPCLLYTS